MISLSDSIAQSFKIVAPENITGIYLTKIDLYFRTKVPKTGVEVFLVETNLGLPNSSAVLGSSYVDHDSMNVSEDASAATTFQFKEPIFVNNLMEYAIVFKVDGNAPGINVWCSEIGGVDVLTGSTISSNPYSGTLYISGNNNAWTPKQDEDLKFKVYRADFTSNVGEVILKNQEDEYVTYKDLTKQPNIGNIEIGDIIVRQDLANANNIVIDSNDNNYYRGKVQSIDEVNSKMIIDRSNGNLQVNQTYQIHRPVPTADNPLSNNPDEVIANGNLVDAPYNTDGTGTKVGSFVVVSIDNIEYHAVVPRFSTLVPDRTQIRYEYFGTAFNYITDTESPRIRNGTETEFFDKTRYLISRTNEKNNMPNRRSSKYRIRMSTNSSLVSPAIDLRSRTSIFIRNLINNDLTDEHLRYGSAQTKYVSRDVILEASLGEAEDIMCIVGAYRPVDTDIAVYVKVKNSNDNDSFQNKLWTRMNLVKGNGVFSDPVNREDYREYEFQIPQINRTDYNDYTGIILDDRYGTTAYLNQDNNNIIEYELADGRVAQGYNQFAFKIVLLSEDPVFVPILQDFRGISLQR